MARTPFTPKRPPLYVLPGSNPGLVVKGTIDINNRPEVQNRDEGGISTVYTSSNEVVIKGRRYEMLFPQVIPVGRGQYRVVSARQAYFYAIRTGKHLGIFDTVAHANAYSIRLHRQQAALLRNG